jgi:hypothetical protein
VPQLPERCLSRKAGIVRCCHKESGTLAAKVRVPDFVVLYRREYELLFPLIPAALASCYI